MSGDNAAGHHRFAIIASAKTAAEPTVADEAVFGGSLWAIIRGASPNFSTFQMQIELVAQL